MLQFRLSNVILMATTKKIVKEYTQKEMRRKLRCFTKKKKSAKHKRRQMQQLRHRKPTEHIENNNMSLPISNYSKYKWIQLSIQQRDGQNG